MKKKHRTPGNSSKRHKLHDVKGSVLRNTLATQSIAGCKSARNQEIELYADVYEWIGDSVVEELVKRCFLSQLDFVKVNEKVLTDVCKAMVTNASLAHVFDNMKMERYLNSEHRIRTMTFETFMSDRADRTEECHKKYLFAKRKLKADVVESIVGELSLCVLLRDSFAKLNFVSDLEYSEGKETKYEFVLDMIVSELMREYKRQLRAEAEAMKPSGGTDFSLLEWLDTEDAMHVGEEIQSRDFDCSIGELIKEKEQEERMAQEENENEIILPQAESETRDQQNRTDNSTHTDAQGDDKFSCCVPSSHESHTKALCTQQQSDHCNGQVDESRVAHCASVGVELCTVVAMRSSEQSAVSQVSQCGDHSVEFQKDESLNSVFLAPYSSLEEPRTLKDRCAMHDPQWLELYESVHRILYQLHLTTKSEYGPKRVGILQGETFRMMNEFGTSLLHTKVSQLVLLKHQSSAAERKAGTLDTLLSSAKLTYHRQEVLSKENILRLVDRIELYDVRRMDASLTEYEFKVRKLSMFRALVGYLYFLKAFDILVSLLHYLFYVNTPHLGGSFTEYMRTTVEGIECTATSIFDVLERELELRSFPTSSRAVFSFVSSEEAKEAFVNRRTELDGSHGDNGTDTVTTHELCTEDSLWYSSTFGASSERLCAMYGPTLSGNSTSNIARQKLKLKQKLKRKLKRKRALSMGSGSTVTRKDGGYLLDRYCSSYFFVALEEVIVAFAKRDIESTKTKLDMHEETLASVVSDYVQCTVQSEYLQLDMKDAFYRLLVHTLCKFHGLKSTSISSVETNRKVIHVEYPSSEDPYEWKTISGRMYEKTDSQPHPRKYSLGTY